TDLADPPPENTCHVGFEGIADLRGLDVHELVACSDDSSFGDMPVSEGTFLHRHPPGREEYGLDIDGRGAHLCGPWRSGQGLAYSCSNSLLAGNECLLQRRGERNGSVRRSDGDDGGFQRSERAACHEGCDVCCNATARIPLIDDHQMSSPLDGVDDRVLVQGRCCPRVDELYRNALLAQSRGHS